MEDRQISQDTASFSKQDLLRLGGCMDHPVRIAATKRTIERDARVSLRELCGDLGFEYGEKAPDTDSYGNSALTFHLQRLKTGGFLGSRGQIRNNQWWVLDTQRQLLGTFLDTIDPYLSYDQLPNLGRIAAGKKSKRREFDDSIESLSLSEMAQVIGSVLSPIRYEAAQALLAAPGRRLFLDQIRSAVGVDKQANGSPNLSYHLGLLKFVKLLDRKLEGRSSVYYLRDSKVTELVRDLLNLEPSSHQVSS